MNAARLAHILCCKCGVSMVPNSANTCVACLASEVDIAKHIDRQNNITFCPKCERYLNPPSQWVVTHLESPELLSMCIKRVKGLNRGLKFKEARFIWTEPHSRRIKIEITVHGELPTGDVVEQKVPIEFVVHSQQCSDCNRTAAKDYWNACVQVRQRVEHKKTLLNLEQVILKSRAHSECSNIKQVSDGIDFFFGTRSQAVSFVNFLCKHAPCRYQTSQHLKSHDIHNNTYNYKFTFSVEIAAICKNDIVCLSKSQSQRLGGLGPICVITKVAEAIHLIDPVTCQIGRVDGTAYFASSFTAIASQKQFSSFIVVELEEESQAAGGAKSHPVGAKLSAKYRPASVWLMRLNTSTNAGHTEDNMIHTRSHLGHILRVGDTVNGFDVRNCNVNHSEFEKLTPSQVQDVILVLRPPQPGEEDLAGGSSRTSKPKRKRKHSAGGGEESCSQVPTELDSIMNFSDLDDETELDEGKAGMDV